VGHVTAALGVSERFACRVLGQHRSTQRKAPRVPDDEAALRDEIIALAQLYGRYGDRRVTSLLHAAGWGVNHKRVERIWRQEGLKVPARQRKRGRLWRNDGSCIRLRPERPNPVWAYDFVEDRTREGRKFRMLWVVDEFIPSPVDQNLCSQWGDHCGSQRRGDRQVPIKETWYKSLPSSTT
jgi:transposase InsO family protein